MRNEITFFAKSLSGRFSIQPNEKCKRFTRGIFLVLYHPLLKKLNNDKDKIMYVKGEIKKVFSLILETLFSSSRNPVRVKFSPVIMVVSSPDIIVGNANYVTIKLKQMNLSAPIIVRFKG